MFGPQLLPSPTLPPSQPQTTDSSVRSHGLNIWTGSVLLALWLAVLVVTVVLGTSLSNPPPPLQWWQVFYRTGSIIYGGGQVVLPMLYNDVVQQTCDSATGLCVDKPNTWVTSKQFYAGWYVGGANSSNNQTASAVFVCLFGARLVVVVAAVVGRASCLADTAMVGLGPTLRLGWEVKVGAEADIYASFA